MNDRINNTRRLKVGAKAFAPDKHFKPISFEEAIAGRRSVKLPNGVVVFVLTGETDEEVIKRYENASKNRMEEDRKYFRWMSFAKAKQNYKQVGIETYRVPERSNRVTMNYY